jgi:hypothetical protein
LGQSLKQDNKNNLWQQTITTQNSMALAGQISQYSRNHIINLTSQKKRMNKKINGETPRFLMAA